MGECKTNTNISMLYSFNDMNNADSIEWCPHEPNRHLFVCANYQLTEASESEDNTSRRFGKIHLFSIHPKNNLTLHQTIDTSAVLDQKWCHNKLDNHSVLGVVNGKNELQIYKLVDESPKLELVSAINTKDDDVMMLSLDWSTGKQHSNEPRIIVSDTKGRVHLFKLNNHDLEKEMSFNGHDFEAWICGFNYWNTDVFFSGGDDSKLLQFDMRAGNDAVLKSSAHSAGVTCIHSNREQEFVLATGSYDTNLLLWDIRKMKSPSNSVEMPGPMWRLKWDPYTYTNLLAACMLGGFHIVGTESEPTILANYYDHTDLAYGTDWCYLDESRIKDFEGKGNRIIGACSFYDHKLSVAKTEIKQL